MFKNKRKKLIRGRIIEKLQPHEFEVIEDKAELNALYALKIREELAEVQASEHGDIMEFVDLIEAAISFAAQNGFTPNEIELARANKLDTKGGFSDIALNNLNPTNASNAIYFNEADPASLILQKIECAIEAEKNKVYTRGQCFSILGALYEEAQFAMQSESMELEAAKNNFSDFTQKKGGFGRLSMFEQIKYHLIQEKIRHKQSELMHIRQYIATIIEHYNLTKFDE